jgi:membrane peptidoglycan carboxypeptidase
MGGGAIMAILLTIFIGMYTRAVFRVEDHDIRKQEPLLGVQYFAAPLPVFRGEPISQAAVLAHLTLAGYRNDSADHGSTYSAVGKTLEVRPQLPEFPAVTLNFDSSGLQTIFRDGAEVESVQLEPETLRNLTTLKTASDDRLRVRQYPIRYADIDGTELLDAVVSSEDSQFFSSGGISLYHIVRSVFEGRGASTITQQAVRACLTQDYRRSVIRKVNEIFLAIALEEQVTKHDIATAYSNCVYTGTSEKGGLQLYGVAAAARHLWGRQKLRDLSLVEAATLAALLNEPSVYLREARQGKPERLRKQRNRVLRLMQRNYPTRYPEQRVDAAEKEAVIFAQTKDEDPSVQLEQDAGYFLDALPKDLPAKSGARIYTTLDAGIQHAASVAAATGIDRLNRTRPDPTGKRKLQVSIVALAASGEVLAMVGGRNHVESDFNRATKARRSPGSAYKPFIYEYVLEDGVLENQAFTAATLIDAARGPTVNGWRPKHHASGVATTRTDLAVSNNGAPMVAASAVGLPAIAARLEVLTGSRPVAVPPMLIGGAAGTEVSPLVLALAYTIFANNGRKAAPQFVAHLFEKDREVVINRAPMELVSQPAATFVTLQMMRSVVGEGIFVPHATAIGALRMAGMPTGALLGAKTGTSQRGDLWFASVFPKMVVVVWVGCDDNQELPGWTGANTALPIWAELVRGIRSVRPDLLTGQFSQPTEVESRPIDPQRGCLAESGPTEYFVHGRLPPQCSSTAVKTLVEKTKEAKGQGRGSLNRKTTSARGTNKTTLAAAVVRAGSTNIRH